MNQFDNLSQMLNAAKGTHFQSADALCLENGEVLFQHRVNCEEQSVFDLASLTKLVTTTFALQLASCGLLNLDEPLAPHFPAAGPTLRGRLEHISLRMLLTHRTGILPWYPLYTSEQNFWQFMEREELFPAKPNDAVLYSDINFMLAGQLVQHVGGKGPEEALANLNLALGTSFQFRPSAKNNCIPTEYGNATEEKMCAERSIVFNGWRNKKTPIQGEVNDGNAFYYWQGVAGHAGLFGTASDMAKLGLLYLNKGMAGQRQVISQELAVQALTNQGGERGLGWNMEGIFSHGAGHNGFTGTSICLCPGKNRCAVLLCNRLLATENPNINSLRQAYFNALFT